MKTFCGITTDGMLDYLATIYRLNQKYNKVTTNILAKGMHVSAAASSSMLKRLDRSGLITRSTSGGIILTPQGNLAALQFIRRHRLLEVFLIQIMNYTWDQVDLEAHNLEHAVSMTFEDRIDRLCDYPTHCPHGDPIPRKDGTLPQNELVSLVDLKPGQTGILRRVGVKEPNVLRYFSRLTLTPGQSVQLLELAPFNGPVTLTVPGSADESSKQIISKELAAELFVEERPL